MHDRIYDLLIKQDEITWQNIILELIKTEQMNPWDVDISLLAKKYLETVRKLQEANFFVSGKVLLASALLLRIKSDKLISEDIPNFDRVLFPPSEQVSEEFEEIEEFRDIIEIPKLAIKTPQTRKRKVSVNDLLLALHKALETSHKKVMKKMEERNYEHPEIPQKKIDITELIDNVYEKLLAYFESRQKVTFSRLVQSEKREDKILTFVPLLHLDNQLKINLEQKEHFGEIDIYKI